MKLISNIPLAQQIVKICKIQNLKHIVVSPGSRNAPLAISFSNDSFFKAYSIVDERCAAFFALGIAQQLKEPVALVCTSGSALLNYYPAIAEAFYSDIPLVILSADRPKEHIDIGDGQTIRQEGVFKNHIIYEANLQNQVVYTNDLKNSNEFELISAIKTSKKEKGPVHINVPFYEPLYETVQAKNIPFNKEQHSKKVKETILDTLNLIKKSWQKSTKKLVLVGILEPNKIEDALLEKLLQDSSVLMFTETTSNLHHSKIIPSIDQLISSLSTQEFERLKPEILLTFGGLVVSKKIKAFLRKYKPQNHWHINSKKAYDTYGCLTKHIKTTPNHFFRALLSSSISSSSNYQNEWLKQYSDRLKGHKQYLKEIPFCDLLVFDKVIKSLPNQVNLQLSNSSTIRYTQLFQLPIGAEVYCNRGTSGIDGSTSTAVGASVINKKQTVLITGDLSFFYDSNALWNNYIADNFKIIIINNDGGGIFRILPSDKKADYFETYLETKHTMRADKLATMYGFNYEYSEEEGLEDKLNAFFENKSKQILEIHTPRLVNDTILLKYFEKIREYY